MKKIYFIIIYFILNIELSFADAGFFGNSISGSKIKDGDIHIDDIPKMIKGSIDFFMQIAGTIAIIFIIIGAYKILFGSLEQDKTKGKDTILMALGGFTLSALAWFIIKVLIDNLS